MEILFENQYERTKEFHIEIITYAFFKRSVIVMFNIIFSQIIVICVLSFYGFHIEIYIFILIITVVRRIIRCVRAIHTSYKQDLENNNGEHLKIKIIVTKEGIADGFAHSESKNYTSYDSIRKIVQSKNYYALITEANQYLIFKKEGFIKGRSDEFLSFIKSKELKSKKTKNR